MKYFISFILTLLLAGCNLFQGQQQAGESVAVEEKQQQEEVFVPVQKELYVIDKEEQEDYYKKLSAKEKREYLSALLFPYPLE